MSNTFQQIIESDQLTLVDFFAHWCGPCMNMIPIIDEIKDQFSDHLRILKVDVDKNAAACKTYQIRGVPTFILFRNGNIIWTKVGALTKQDLVQSIAKEIKP